MHPESLVKMTGETGGQDMGSARKKGRYRFTCAVAISAMAVMTPAQGQGGQQQTFTIQSDELGEALKSVSRQSGREIIFTAEAVRGKTAPPLRGTYTPDAAVRALLAGSGLTAEFRKDVILIRGRAEAPGAIEESSADDGAILITGTRIRGSEPASRMITTRREEIERRGRTDLGAFVRDLPQNFSGGQNPGVVGGGNQGGNENQNSSSALNLRGLGPDATLTLINGHRVAYDGALQGVDISSIPLAAVERLEIVADGASALYGSDAVGGVANIILRRDFEGLWGSARFGASTDGGNQQQQYNLVAGHVTQTGGLLLALDYNRSTAVTAAQRSYTAGMDGSATLIPGQRQYSAVLTGHQNLGDNLVLEIDGQFSDRTSLQSVPNSTTSDARTNGLIATPESRSYSITPTLRWTIADNWTLSLTGTHGNNLTLAPSTTYAAGVATSRRAVRYENGIDIVELGGEGALFDLPGGAVRLAAGGGYRSITLDSSGRLITPTMTRDLVVFNKQRDVTYGYGELSLPIVGAANRTAFIHDLRVSGAVRYENYQGIGSEASPRLGIVYKLVEDVTLKGSWGKSFKAPTFYDQYRIYQTLLFPMSFFGPNAGPADQAVIYVAGGNPNLKPERATTWSATIILEPRVAPGLKIEASYFDINYRDRVASPVASILGVFQNPIYQHLIVYSPTQQQIDPLVAGAPFGLENYTGQPYSPANVFAILNANIQNSARQKIHGVDLAASYVLDAGDDHFDLSVSASYLKSNRQLIDGMPTVQNAGIIFNPPNWRGQGGGTWTRGNLSFTAFANYTGGTSDNRLTPFVSVGSFFSLDTVAQIRSNAAAGLFKDVGFTLSVTNVFNRKPSAIRTSSPTDPAYDSTNYPTTGRVVSFTISKAL